MGFAFILRSTDDEFRIRPPQPTPILFTSVMMTDQTSGNIDQNQCRTLEFADYPSIPKDGNLRRIMRMDKLRSRF